MAEKVTFINSRGQSIELTNRRPFLLQSVDGKGDVQADAQLQKAPFQHGNSYIGSQLQSRPISLLVSILAEDEDALLERQQYLASVFNPILGEGKLIYEKGQTKREIQAVSESVPIYPTGSDNKGIWYQRAMINLICPSPFWEDIEETRESMNVFVGAFEFPIEIEEPGMIFGTQGEKLVINNVGDVPTPVVIEFNGPAINPKVINNRTGEYILVNRSLEANQTLVLSTAFGEKRVEIHEDGNITNAFAWIDLNSTFWELELGENEVEYEADIGTDAAKVFIRYKNRYVSV